MRHPRRFGVLVCLSLLLLGTEAAAQGSKADYERADQLTERFRDLVRNAKVQPQWSEDGNRLWYERESADGGTEFVVVDCMTGTRTPLHDVDELLARVRRAADEEEGFADPITALDGRAVYFFFGARLETWRCSLDGKKATRVPFDEPCPLHLSPTTRANRSRGRGAETWVLFVNGLDVPLELFWINGEGHRRSYGTIEPGKTHRQHTFGRHAWVLVDDRGKDRAAFRAADRGKVAHVDADTTAPSSATGARDEKRSEGEERRLKVFFRDHNAWLRDHKRDKELALTTDGTADQRYDRVAAYSPDGSQAVVLRTVPGEQRTVYYVEAAPRDQLQPKLHSYTYRKPGDRIPVSKPWLVDLKRRKVSAIDDALFENPWSIDRFRWSPDGSQFTFLFNQRGHQVVRVVSVDAKTGEAQAIVDEQATTFVDYSQKLYLHHLDATDELIWASERDGWNHLYLYDARTGKVKNRITTGDWCVRGVDEVDEESRQIWFRAGGIHRDQDPYHVHHARVNFDGTGLTILTEGDGTHEITRAPGGKWYLDRYSRVDLPPVTELRRTKDGALVCELERADWSDLRAEGWNPPERFVTKGRDGKTDIWGIVRRPTNHDPAKRYPVIEYIYAGPHGSFVPKSFHVRSKQNELAELGFIVVQIDGMGTNHRSKAFHDVAWKNLGDSGFPDRIKWIEALATRYSSLDLSRIGIYGGSAGGQSSTRALLAHGDFYHVAVSDCGCHDNRMDKIWWNEAWMGWPVGPHYAEQSNVTQAHRLTGDLLLIVGEKDENVDPASTMQVVDALIRADKDFEMLVIPSAGHGAAESSYGIRRRRDFFVRKLLGVEPRWE